MFSQTLAHGNCKIGIKKRNRGRRKAEINMKSSNVGMEKRSPNGLTIARATVGPRGAIQTREVLSELKCLCVLR